MGKLLSLILLLPILAWAQSPFDGTWTINITAPLKEEPNIVVLQDGIFQLSSGKLKVTVKADGTDRPVPELKTFDPKSMSDRVAMFDNMNIFFDTMAIRVVEDKTVELTYKKGREVVFSVKETVSADGNTRTDEGTNNPQANEQRTYIYKKTYVRVAPGPAGSHAISGTWSQQMRSTSFTITYKSSPNGLMMMNKSGEWYEAKFNGKDYPVKGSPSETISLTKVNDRTIISTDKLDGTILGVSYMTVSDDGKTLTLKNEFRNVGAAPTITMTKQ